MNPISLYRETPCTIIAALGLGTAVFASELDTMTSIKSLAATEIAVYGFLASALVLAAVGFTYLRRPTLRLSQSNTASFSVALLTALCMLMRALGADEESRGLSILLFAGFQAGSLVLVVVWCEMIIRLGSHRTGLIFALAIVAYALCNGITMLLRPETADAAMAAIPLVTVALLAVFKARTKNGHEKNAIPAIEHQAVAQNSLMLLFRDRTAGRKANTILGTLALTSIFLLRFGFDYIVESWMPLQDASTISLLGQASNLIGTMAAAILLLLLVATCWNQSTLPMVEVCSIAALMVALFLLIGFSDEFARHGIGLVSFGTKLALFLALICPFLLDAKTPPFILCIALSVNMASLGTYSVISLNVAPEALFSLTLTATGALFALCIALFILVEGNHSESASVVMHRLDQSTFNSAEAWPKQKDHLTDSVRLEGIAVHYNLTQRETEVVRLLIERYNAEEIAKRLVISEATVKTHMRKIYAKANVHSQRELIKLLNGEQTDE